MQDAGLVCSLKADYPNFKLDTEFSVRKGELVCIIGPSGCGKSTTLSILSGLLDGDDGTSIILDGNDITRLAPEKRQVALVFQDYAIFPQMNVQDNIAYSLKLQKVPRKERTAKISAWLDLVSLSGFQKRKPSQLSGGERQRVALARALASQPKLLLLDEPLSALDTKLRRHLREEIRRIHDETGVTMVYVTHDQEEAMAIADRIIVMNQGHIEQMGEPEELYHHPKTLFTATFMGDGTTMHVVPNLFYGGREVFAGGEGSGAKILFHSPFLNLWVYRDGSTIVEPRSYKDLDGETVLGDAWYSGYFGDLPYLGNGNPPHTTLEADGTIEGAADMTLTLKWPRWMKRSGDAVVNDSIHPVQYPPVGVYQAVDQEADDIVIGVPIWRDESGARYERSESKDENGYWTYGIICFQNGYWSPAGETYPRSANEPNRDGPVSFVDKDGNVILKLTFYGLGTGARTAVRYVGEACVWRE